MHITPQEAKSKGCDYVNFILIHHIQYDYSYSVWNYSKLDMVLKTYCQSNMQIFLCFMTVLNFKV